MPGRKIAAFIAILAFLSALTAAAADWLNAGGDRSQSGLQKRESILTPSSVKGLKLIWKLKLGAQPLTAPVILGHWITNRGTKELIFIADSSNKLYAVDADLGRLFWTRELEGGASTGRKTPCNPGLTAAPALTAGPDVENEDDDVQQAIRPLYVLSSEGLLHALHPTTGKDLSDPIRFLPPHSKASDLIMEGHVISTATPGGCGSALAGIWTVDVSAPGAVAARRALSPRPGPDTMQATANGVVFKLSKVSPSAHAILSAFDAATGKRLYSSGDSIASYIRSGGIALANGHICFGTEDGTLYCFGFPVDL